MFHCTTTTAPSPLSPPAHRWHEAHGTLGNEQAIRDRSMENSTRLPATCPGFSIPCSSLANQQVKGVNKILRARSFLLGMTVEAAALRCRRELVCPCST